MWWVLGRGGGGGSCLGVGRRGGGGGGAAGRLSEWGRFIFLGGGGVSSGALSANRSLTGGRGGSGSPSSLLVRPRILRDSAVFKNELSCSWATLTSPLYMNWSSEVRSSYLMSRRTMM